MQTAVTFSRHTITLIRTGVFVLTLLGTTVLPMFSDLPSAFAGTDTYPTSIAGCRYVSTGGSAGTCDLKNSAQDYYYDPWGEENRECTSYAAWMLHSVNGFEMPFYDSAYNWGPRAQALGYAVNMSPAVGSIYWTAGTGQYHTGQHVAWVESVSTDGSSVTIEDYNSGYNGLWAEHPGVATSSASGYIHFKDIATPYHYQPFAADFNGDGYADIGLRDVNTGTWFIKHGPSFNDQVTYAWASGTHFQSFAADFDGDGYADIGLYDQNTGVFYIKHGPSFTDQLTYQWVAGDHYQSLAADFNGDGYADIGLLDVNTGTWFIKHGPSFSDQLTCQWVAGTHYQSFAADFNGDHLADIGLLDVNTGTWFIKHGPDFSDQLTYNWVAGTHYQSLAADFNGDHLADIGLRDVNTGTWFIKHGTSFSDQLTYQWVPD